MSKTTISKSGRTRRLTEKSSTHPYQQNSQEWEHYGLNGRWDSSMGALRIQCIVTYQSMEFTGLPSCQCSGSLTSILNLTSSGTGRWMCVILDTITSLSVAPANGRGSNHVKDSGSAALDSTSQLSMA